MCYWQQFGGEGFVVRKKIKTCAVSCMFEVEETGRRNHCVALPVCFFALFSWRHLLHMKMFRSVFRSTSV